MYQEKTRLWKTYDDANRHMDGTLNKPRKTHEESQSSRPYQLNTFPGMGAKEGFSMTVT
jgi:hypothetical protein